MKILVEYDGNEHLDSSARRALSVLENRGIIKDWFVLDGKLRIVIEAKEAVSI